MDTSNDVLKKFVASKSKFFNLADGEEVRATFLRAEIVPNNFDGGKTTLIRYHLQIDDTVLYWDRSSRQLAQEMSKASEGEMILIKRSGEKSKTRYVVKVIKP